MGKMPSVPKIWKKIN